MPNTIKQIEVSSATYDISAKYIIEYPAVGDPIEHDWKDITDLIAVGIQLVPLDVLPAANEENYTRYSGKIVLIPIAGSDDRADYIITRSGNEGSYTYSWDMIGTTKADLETKVTKGTYTTETPSTNTTSAYAGETVTTSSAGSQEATGTANITYNKATITSEDGAVTIQGSNFNFNGTKATLTQNIDYAPEGSVEVKAVGTHSHTVNIGTPSKVDVVTSVEVGNTTPVVAAAIDSASLTGQTTFMKNATVSNGVLSFVNDTVGITTTNATTTNVVTSVTVGSQTPVINAMPVITLTQETEQTINGTFTGSPTTFTISINYTPSGTIGGSQEIASHSHSVINTPTSTVGTAAVAVGSHTHTVDIPSHTHDLGNHTHDINLN